MFLRLCENLVLKDKKYFFQKKCAFICALFFNFAKQYKKTHKMEKLKFITAIDWLSFSGEISTPEIFEEDYNFLLNDKYHIERCSGTNIFQNRFIVWDTSLNKVATILCNPKSSLLSNWLCLLEIGNYYLYNGRLEVTISEICEIFQIRLEKISRLDVCCDFQKCYRSDSEVMRADIFIYQLFTNVFYVQGKKEGACFFDIKKSSKNDKIFNMPRQIGFGSKTSEIKWKIYNKTKEINECSQKYYIRESWRGVFDESRGDVWRCECSISHFSTYEFDLGENISFAMNDIYMKDLVAKLFVCLQQKRFQIRVNQGNANSSRNEIVPIFGNFENNFEISKRAGINNVPRDEIKSYIRASVGLCSSHYQKFHSERAVKIANEIIFMVKEGNWQEWFSNAFGFEVEDIKMKLFNKKIDGNGNFRS